MSEARYRIAVEPVAGSVRVRIAGQTVVESDNTAIMHETYLPSHCYFPKEDLTGLSLDPSELRTFCPFKGTAHHWHLTLGDQTFENGVWSYERPLPEAEGITGRVAFYPNLIEELSSDQPLPAPLKEEVAGGPLVDWLMRGAWLCKTPAQLTEQFAERLCAIGMPVWRLNVNIWTLHPVLAGQRYTWTRDSGEVVESDTPYGALQQPAYLNSPVRHVSDGFGGVRQRLDVDDPEFQFPVMADLRAKGGTDYVAMPLFFSDGAIQTLTIATDDPAGFSTSHLGETFGAVIALARFYEVLTLRHNTTVLFDTYLGQRTRHEVLSGAIHRGDGADIRAAILYCDLRDSTSLAGSLSRERYLSLLNDFFEHAAEPVMARGGEVLKFIGDAVLAIFPLDADESNGGKASAVCRTARDAAQEIVEKVAAIPVQGGGEPLRCAIGLHVGDVMYGNVGAPKRLDFTVTGTAANVAARLSGQCKTLEQSLLLSSDIARYAPEGLQSLGAQRLRHVAQDVEVFALAGAEFG